jgi:hypothetical protein
MTDAVTTLSVADAAAYQASFDAVAAGEATAGQIAEVQAVVIGLTHYLRDAGALAEAQARSRAALTEALPEERAAAVTAALDGADAAGPRLWWDGGAKTLVTPETADAVAAAKAAASAEREAG